MSLPGFLPARLEESRQCCCWAQEVHAPVPAACDVMVVVDDQSVASDRGG